MVRIIIYIVIIIAELLIFENSFLNLMYMKKRYMSKSIYKSKLFIYIKKMLTVIKDELNQEKINMLTYRYLLTSAFIFMFTFTLIFLCNIRFNDFFMAVLISFICSMLFVCIPFMILRFKLKIIRSKSSYEAMILISEIINQYKIHDQNILEAIDKSILYLPEDMISKKHLIRLSMGIKQYKTEDELHEITNQFSYSIGTSWAIMLSDSIYIAVTDHFDISASLNGILKHIAIIESNIRYGKKLTNEGFVLAKIFAPILYIIMIFIMKRMLNIQARAILIYQFRGEGLKFFILIAVVFIICLIEEYLYKNKKFDI